MIGSRDWVTGAGVVAGLVVGYEIGASYSALVAA